MFKCLSSALCGEVEEQQVQVTGEVPSDGRQFRPIQAISAGAGGDGGGVERPAVLQPRSPITVEWTRHQGGAYVKIINLRCNENITGKVLYLTFWFTPQVYTAQQEYDELSAFEEIQQELIAQGYTGVNLLI